MRRPVQATSPVHSRSAPNPHKGCRQRGWLCWRQQETPPAVRLRPVRRRFACSGLARQEVTLGLVRPEDQGWGLSQPVPTSMNLQCQCQGWRCWQRWMMAPCRRSRRRRYRCCWVQHGRREPLCRPLVPPIGPLLRLTTLALPVRMPLRAVAEQTHYEQSVTV